MISERGDNGIGVVKARTYSCEHNDMTVAFLTHSGKSGFYNVHGTEEIGLELGADQCQGLRRCC